MLHLIAAEGPNEVHLPADINEVYWGTAAFLVVMALLIRLAGPAIAGAFRKRTADIEAELAAARAARAEAEAALTATSSDLPDVSVEEARIKAEAADAAARLKDDMIARAQADADEIRTRGNAEVENQRRQALADLRAEVSEMTRQSAEAVVTDQLDDSAQNDLIENYIRQVEQL